MVTLGDLGDGRGESAEALLSRLLFWLLPEGLGGDDNPEDLLEDEGLFSFFGADPGTSIVKGVDGELVGFLASDGFRFLDWVLEGEGLGERYCLDINPSGTSIISGKVIAAFLLLLGSPES